MLSGSNDGPIIVNTPAPAPQVRPSLLARLFQKKDSSFEKPAEPQVIDFKNPPMISQPLATPTGPMMVNEAPKPLNPSVETPADPTGPMIVNRPPPQASVDPIGPTPPLIVPLPPQPPLPAYPPVAQPSVVPPTSIVGNQPIPMPANPNTSVAPTNPTPVGPLPTPANPNTSVVPMNPSPVGPLPTPTVPMPTNPNPAVTPSAPLPPPVDPRLTGNVPVPTPANPNTSVAPSAPLPPPVDPRLTGNLPVPTPAIPNTGVAPLTPTPSVAPEPALPPIFLPPPPAPGFLGDPSKQDVSKSADPTKKSWRPGDKLFGWLQGKPATDTTKKDPIKSDIARTDPAKPDAMKPLAIKSDATKPEDKTNVQKAEDLLAQQNKLAEKKLQDNVQKIYGAPFSTAMGMTPTPASQSTDKKNTDSSPLAIPSAASPAKDDKLAVLPPPPGVGDVKPVGLPTGPESKDMWGLGSSGKIQPPGKSLLDPASMKPEVVKLPSAPGQRRDDPLTAPERLIAGNERTMPRNAVMGPQAPPLDYAAMGQPMQMPPGSQSVLAARSGLQGPVAFVPVPTVTVPQPNNPPLPPAPQIPDGPHLNAYVNAFSAQPQPKGMQQQIPMQGMMPPQMMAMAPYGYPMMTQQQMQQQMLQQAMMQYGYRPNPYMPQYPMMAQAPQGYGYPMPSQGPINNYSRQYTGPQPPNPFAANPAVQTGYAPMMPQQQMMPMQQMMPQQPVQPVNYQPAQPTQQVAITQQVEQLIKVLRESSYPSQREWAAQSLTSFEWRAHPQIVPALLSSASQDPAASVRAGCVACLGRMNAAVEPVFGTLHAMRNDIDPRVRQEVEQAFVRLGQTPIAPQN